MINIDVTNDTKVTVKMEGGPLNTTFWFNHECGNKYYAELLAAHFNKKLGDVIRRVREEEYNKGYKDGRAKRGKISSFFSSLRLRVYH